MDNGVIVYEERGPNTQTVSINEVDLSVKDFRVTRAFDFTLKLAILSDKQNVDISGTAGPLASDGRLDLKDAHFAIEEKVGPLDLAQAARDWFHRQGDSRGAFGARSGFVPGERQRHAFSGQVSCRKRSDRQPHRVGRRSSTSLPRRPSNSAPMVPAPIRTSKSRRRMCNWATSTRRHPTSRLMAAT